MKLASMPAVASSVPDQFGVCGLERVLVDATLLDPKPQCRSFTMFHPKAQKPQTVSSSGPPALEYESLEP